MNIRILNRVNAWKNAGKRGIVKKRMDRKAKINEINEIKKIERNLMENSGAKN